MNEKKKDFYINTVSEVDLEQQSDFSACVYVCVCWVVVCSQLSAPQGHHTNRDSWGRGPSQAGTLSALCGP